MTETKFEQCIHAMNRGDKEGLRMVYEEYVSYIFGIVRNLLSNREDAEDVTSDFFIRLWEKSESYRPGSGHKGWMATIARNMAIDRLRKYKKEDVVDFLEANDSEEPKNQTARLAIQASADVCVEEKVIADISIQEALSKLKESERLVIHMKIIGEMTFQEISDSLGEPMGTITWRYREAIKKLRRYGYEGSEDGI